MKKTQAKKTETLGKVKKGRRGEGNNPYKVNQYTGPDPRQQLFLAHYLDPQSETFSNGLQSALKAGYEPNYAQIMLAQQPDWLLEKLSELDILKQAERNLKDMLEMETKVQAMGAFGPIFEKTETGEKIPVYTTHNVRLKVKAEMTKFALERLNKKKFGQNQPPSTTVNILVTDDQVNAIARRQIEVSDASSKEPLSRLPYIDESEVSA